MPSDARANAQMIVHGFPFNPEDIWKLSKGDTITAETCELAFGCKRETAAFRLALLKGRARMEQWWREMRGEQITTATVQDGLHICTDDEAVKQNDRTVTIGVRRVRRGARQIRGIDVSQVSPERREMLVRLGIRAAALLSGGQRQVQAALKAYRSARPSLLPSADKPVDGT